MFSSFSFIGTQQRVFASGTSQWSMVYSGSIMTTPYNMTCASPVNCIEVGSASTGGYILVTSNGTTWTNATIPSGITQVSGIACIDTQDCVAVGQNASQGIALYSSNGGTTWTLGQVPSTVGALNGVSCVTASYCAAVGQSKSLSPSAVYSTNGGITWTASVLPGVQSQIVGLNAISCGTAFDCIATGSHNSGLNTVYVYMFSSNNGGQSWDYVNLPSSQAFLMGSVQCKGASVCYVAGYSPSLSVSQVEVTTDLGQTWTLLTLPANTFYTSSMSCLDTSTCMIVATGSNTGIQNMLTTTDGGLTWSTDNIFNSGQSGTASLISCPASSECYIEMEGYMASSSSSVVNAIIRQGISVSSVSPSSGTPSGGTSVTINGSGFLEATSVNFGATPTTSFTINSDTSITATSPAGFGSVNINVTNSFGISSSTVPQDIFTYASPEPFHPIAPTRICDTRPIGTGVTSNECDSSGAETLGSNQTLDVQVTGNAGIPSNATAVVANITVANTSANGGWVTVFPGGSSTHPTSSNMNWNNGQTVSNLVTVALGPKGDIEVYNFAGTADIIVDVSGYYGPNLSGNAGEYVPLTPARICDTRPSGNGVSLNQCDSGSNGPINQNSFLTVQIAGNGGVPSSGVSAVALNVTAIGPTTPGGGYLTIYPTGQTQPVVSNLNFTTGQTVPNRVIVKLSSTGLITVFNFNGITNIAIDVNGWFSDGTTTPPGGTLFTPIYPIRICDTRLVEAAISSNQCNTPSAKTLSSNETLSVSATNTFELPSTLSAIVANVTVTSTNANGGYLTLSPSGTTPTVSDLNWSNGTTVANLSLITLSSGSFLAYNFTGSADLIIDVAGFYS